MRKICSLKEACEFFRETFDAHPELDAFGTCRAALAGEKRTYSGCSIAHLASPDDKDVPQDEYELPDISIPEPEEESLAREIIAMLAPLKLLNPVSPAFGLGKGPGTLATCFGIPLNPETCDCPAYNKSIDALLGENPPDPATAGLLGKIHERIAHIKTVTPDTFKIGLPDMQGPFNIFHSLVGIDAMTAPYENEDKFFRLMERVTDFWIEARKKLVAHMGKERLTPQASHVTVCECSVNLVSPDFYRRFILPHDRRIAEAFGPLHIHPCSGPHVFRVTLENLPVAETEAGYIEKTAAGAISVDEALSLIEGKDILLHIGQELPENREFEFIKRDFDLYRDNKRLLFGYCGMHWRKKDRYLIRDIHRKLDDYWRQNYG